MSHHFWFWTCWLLCTLLSVSVLMCLSLSVFLFLSSPSSVQSHFLCSSSLAVCFSLFLSVVLFFVLFTPISFSCFSFPIFCSYNFTIRDANFPLFSVIFGQICSPPIRFPFSIFSIFSYFIFLFLKFLSLFVFIFCETARTRRFSVIFAKVQWHPCIFM